jgi:hypothetical protein
VLGLAIEWGKSSVIFFFKIGSAVAHFFFEVVFRMDLLDCIKNAIRIFIGVKFIGF